MNGFLPIKVLLIHRGQTCHLSFCSKNSKDEAKININERHVKCEDTTFYLGGRIDHHLNWNTVLFFT